MNLSDCYLLPQVLDHGAQIFDTRHVQGEGWPELICVVPEAVCRQCGRETNFFINRWGRTVGCWLCDFLAEKERLEVN